MTELHGRFELFAESGYRVVEQNNNRLPGILRPAQGRASQALVATSLHPIPWRCDAASQARAGEVKDERVPGVFARVGLQSPRPLGYLHRQKVLAAERGSLL